MKTGGSSGGYIKVLVAVITMALLQLATIMVAFEVAIFFMKSCSTTGLSWQCTGSVDPVDWQIAAVLIFPPILAKLVLKKLHWSWKKIILLHVTVLLLFLVFSAITASPDGGGG